MIGFTTRHWAADADHVECAPEYAHDLTILFDDRVIAVVRNLNDGKGGYKVMRVDHLFDDTPRPERLGWWPDQIEKGMAERAESAAHLLYVAKSYGFDHTHAAFMLHRCCQEAQRVGFAAWFQGTEGRS